MARRLIAGQLSRLLYSSSPKPFSYLHSSPSFSQNFISSVSTQLKQNRSFSFFAYKPLGMLLLAQGKNNGVKMGRVLTRGAQVLSFSLQRHSGPRQLVNSLRRFWSYQVMVPDGIIWFLVGANIGVFVLWGIADPTFMRNNFMLSLDNIKSGRLHTLITNAFSHSELDHLFTNMIGLYFFGQSIASLFGPKFLLNLYIAGALSGSICFLLHRAFLVPSIQGFIGWDRSRVPSHGASAAVNAIILLEIFLFPKRLVYLYFLVPVPAAFLGALLIGSDLYRLNQGQSRVSGEAHLGGALVAALVWARIRKRWI